MNKILLTGASGFIGSNIYTQLLRQNFYVDCIIRKKSDKFQNTIIHNLKHEFNMNYRNNYDCIIHAAAVSPKKNINFDDYYYDNIVATKNLIDFANKNKVKKFIFLSSISALGEINDKLINSYTPVCNPLDYGLSKLICERLLLSKKNKFKSLSIRLPGVLGKNSVRNLLTEIMSKVKSNKDIDIYNPDSKFNNCVDVIELSNFIVELAEHKITNNDVFPIGAAKSLKIIDIVQKIINKVGSTSKIRIINKDILSFRISNACAIKKYNYKPNSVVSILDNFIKYNK